MRSDTYKTEPLAEAIKEKLREKDHYNSLGPSGLGEPSSPSRYDQMSPEELLKAYERSISNPYPDR